MISELPKYILVGLISTIIIETIVSKLIGIKKQDLIYVILVNILTNPIVVTIPFILNIYYDNTLRHISLGILEVIALISEGFIYKRTLDYKKNPYLLSLYLNLSSYTLGLIINYIM